MSQILLGTVAIEPNRWGTVRADRSPSTVVEHHLQAIAGAGFDGIELWDGHLRPSTATDARAAGAPVQIFNSYVSFDEVDRTERDAVAQAVASTGARGVKFNVGNVADAEGLYIERVAGFVDELPDSAAAICECHRGISIAEDPAVAARILEAAGPADRVQALVHTHDDDDQLRACFDAYGDRISHVHVNFLDFATMSHPSLAQIEGRVRSTVDLIRSFDFAGSWTIEFVAGLLTDRDTPERLIEQAATDLQVLRYLLPESEHG